MSAEELTALLDRLRHEPRETEWLEFKENHYEPQVLGEYLSALANAACLAGKPRGYLVFGIQDQTHAVVGTQSDPYAVKAAALVEGRYPNLLIAARVARLTGQKARHIRERGFSKQYYLDAIEALIREHQPIPRLEIDRLLMDKLPEVLSASQKKAKIHNLMAELSRSGRIENRGSRGRPAWHTVNGKPGV